MGQEFYAVLFRAGSSGRLIGNIIWGSLFPNKYSFTTSQYNSTHTQAPWGDTFKFNTEIYTHIWRDINFFNKIEILSNPALLTSHTRPNFDNFFTKFPFGKLVVITLNQPDIFEVCCNSMLKNGFENFEFANNSEKIYIINQYKQKFGMPPTSNNFSEEFKKDILIPYYNTVIKENMEKHFMNLTVPEQYASQILLLPYSMIVNDKESTLNNISNFINKNIPNNVVKFYETYLLGRNELVNKYMI